MTSKYSVNPRAVTDIGVEREQMRREARSLIGEAVVTLTAKQAYVVLQRARGLTFGRIASMMGVTIRAVEFHEVLAHHKMLVYFRRKGIHSYSQVA